MSEELKNFVKDCYKAGKSHSEIEEVLKEAGWDNALVSEALGRFEDRDFPVAIPKYVVFASPRLVFLNLFYFLVLYLCIYNVVSMLFTFLDYNLPDGVQQMRGSYYKSHRPIGESLRWYLSMVICTLPLVWWSSRIIKNAFMNTKQRIPRIRLILVYLTMFFGACVMLGNVACFINYFLSGELGLRFIIKVLILSSLVAGLYVYFKIEINETECKA